MKQGILDSFYAKGREYSGNGMTLQQAMEQCAHSFRTCVQLVKRNQLEEAFKAGFERR